MIIINYCMVYSQANLSCNLYSSDPYFLNPAYAGYQNFLSANLSYKQTSASIEGAPVLFGFGINSPVYKNMSMGVRFYKQSEGLFNNVSALIDYSYQVKLRNTHFLRFGLSTGVKLNQLDRVRIIAEDPSAIEDVASKNYEGVFFQSAAGIAYTWGNLDFSFSVPQIFDTKKTFDPDYVSYIAYKFPLKQYGIKLKPSILITYNPSKLILYDINLNAIWKDKFFVGFAYRNRPSIIFSAGFNFQKLTVAYAIELALNNQSNIFNQIHEISVSYSFRKIKTIVRDTISEEHFPLLVKNDSLKIDSSAGNFNNNATKDSVLNSKNQNIQKDSITFSINKKNQHKIDDFEVLEIGDGVYSIKLKDLKGDSLINLFEGDTGNLKNAAVVDELITKIVTDRKIEADKAMGSYYSIQLIIDESNNYLLRDAEIAVDTWFMSDEKGHFIYYFSHYNTMEEAQKDFSKFKKYPNLKLKVVQIQVEN